MVSVVSVVLPLASSFFAVAVSELEVEFDNDTFSDVDVNTL